MKNLKLDGVDVETSGLTQRAYKAAYCEILLSITNDNIDEQLKHLRKEGSHGKYCGVKLVGIDDLSFLQEVPNLLYLEVYNENKFDTTSIESLGNLRGLHLECPKISLDFANFPLLEVFVGDWHKSNINISRCKHLHQLRVWKYKPLSSDLTELSGLTRLEYLQLVQSNVESLEGIDNLIDLRYLELAYLPKLKNIDCLASLKLSLREIEFESLKRVECYQSLGELDYLRSLSLVGCNDVSDLLWMINLNHLEQFIFNKTNILSNDLDPLLSLPNLSLVHTNNKKSYNYTLEQLKKCLDKKVR